MEQVSDLELALPCDSPSFYHIEVALKPER